MDFFIIEKRLKSAFVLSISKRATVAQSVEQLIRNQQVAGSSPASSSKKAERAVALSAFLCVTVKLEPSGLLIKFSGSPKNDWKI